MVKSRFIILFWSLKLEKNLTNERVSFLRVVVGHAYIKKLVQKPPIRKIYFELILSCCHCKRMVLK